MMATGRDDLWRGSISWNMSKVRRRNSWIGGGGGDDTWRPAPKPPKGEGGGGPVFQPGPLPMRRRRRIPRLKAHAYVPAPDIASIGACGHRKKPAFIAPCAADRMAAGRTADRRQGCALARCCSQIWRTVSCRMATRSTSQASSSAEIL